MLGIFAVLLIVATIIFVSRQLGIQPCTILEVGSPCPTISCGQSYPAEEIGRDRDRAIAYCQCDDGRIVQAPLFA